MTLNQILSRLKTIALAHRQVRRYKTGAASDFFTDHTAKYPACCLQYSGASVNVAAGGFLIVNFRMFLLDLVHVSEDTKDNENDVLSDTLNILMDLVAQIKNSSYNDWIISGDNTLEAVTEYDSDLLGGWYLDFTIKTPFKQNICEIPSDLVIVSPTDSDMKLVYDKIYIATGDEGSALTIPEINGKKILLITREQAPIYKVSSNPNSAEYTWNDTVIGLGVPIEIPGERFLILYRTY